MPVVDSITIPRLEWLDARVRVEPLSPPPSGVFFGNLLRGGFGLHLRKISCVARTLQCPGCLFAERCAYAVVFESRHNDSQEHYKSLDDIPRPYVFFDLPDPETLSAARTFSIGVRLIGRAMNFLPQVLSALNNLAETGFQGGRFRCRAAGISLIQPDGAETPLDAVPSSQLPVISTEAYLKNHPPIPGGPLTVSFITPVRMKKDGIFLQTPDFSSRASHLMRRTAQIGCFHGSGPVDWDFRALLDALGDVRIINHDTAWREWKRFSFRQKSEMQLGGLVGRAIYSPVPDFFHPLLILGQALHVGKAASFGFGKYTLHSQEEQI